MPGVVLRTIPNQETHVGSSIQFRLPDLAEDHVEPFLKATAAAGVELKWFGSRDPHGYTSAHQSWRYAGEHALPRTDQVLSRLFDMRIPLTFSVEDCRQIAAIIGEKAGEVLG